MKTITLTNSLAPRQLLAPDGGVELKDEKTGEVLGKLSEDKGGDDQPNDEDKGGDDKDIFDISSVTNDDNISDRAEVKVKTTKQVKGEDGILREVEEEVKDDKEKAKDEEVKEEEEVKDDKIVQLDPKKEVKARDYTGLEAKDVEYLKKLPNVVYNHVRPLLGKIAEERQARSAAEGELEKIKKNPGHIPDAWYEHPEAYTLTPEFNKVSSLYNRAETEEGHWEQQLALIKGGAKTWRALNYDGKTGQYSLAAEMPVDNGTEIQLQKAMNTCATLKAQYQQQAGALQGTFKQQIESRKTHYDFSEKQFNSLADVLKPTKEEQDKFMAIVHPADKSLPITQVAAKMFSVILRQGGYIQKLRAEAATKVKNNNDELRAGPKNQHGKGGAVIKGGKADDEVNLDDIINEVQGNND